MYNECTLCKQNSNFLHNLDINHKDKIEKHCCQSGKECCNIDNNPPTKQETQEFLHFYSFLFKYTFPVRPMKRKLIKKFPVREKPHVSIESQ